LTLKSSLFKNPKVKEKDLLSLEIAEVKEIADLIFKRLNRKIGVLEAIEQSVDEKIRLLETLIRKAESLKTEMPTSDRHNEIVSLGRKGMQGREIAAALDIPVGEVELVLSLRGVKSPANN
jgi:DNA-binding NarL/FixJ family response regulator